MYLASWVHNERGKIVAQHVDHDATADPKLLDELERQIQRIDFMPVHSKEGRC